MGGRRRAGVVAAWVVVCAACAPIPHAADAPPDASLVRIRLEDQEIQGISGLAQAPGGALWAVGERDHLLLEISTTDGSTVSRREIEGLDRGKDLESLAWLGQTTFAVGTEMHAEGRQVDTIYVVELEDGGALVSARIELPYRSWGVASRSNLGIEGLCAVGEMLVAGVEMPVQRDGKRLAPLGRYDMGTREWTPLWLELTTGSGKLSALDCRMDGDAFEVLAVERHYAVSRVLRFALPSSGVPDEPIVPEVVLDLAPLKRFTDNFEGIVRIDDESAFLIIDNDSGGVSGSNALFRVTWP